MASGRLRAVTLSSVALLAATAGACSAVLGLDAPHLDPCANGCADGSVLPPLDAGPVVVDGSVVADALPVADAGADQGAPDVAIDQGPIVGIRCGGGGAPTIGCDTATPICCLVLDAGTPSYSCDSDASACTGGYPITCTTNNDCAGSDVCCHYNSSIKCEGQTVCPSNSLVCDPNGPADQCPSGWKCSVAFVNDGYTLPYYGCSP